uniref:ARID domain-containing protein n=1 Tax=Amphiprion ocellaris TaxID=80972 RepID=A0A3Q1AU45_AMPOC
MEKAQGEFQEERTKEPVEEITEEQFLKDLYLFMKKRDTPIERIPHLGFKQIDLFVMFKTVSDLGGYHQVTSQQLWKQVYNTLGGNPRSTSAATCTRRHYEKLLLPYECHVKGILMSSFIRTLFLQRLMNHSFLSQGPHNLQSDPRGSLFPLPFQYTHYYHPSHTVLPPYLPVTSTVLPPQSPAVPKAQLSLHPPHLIPSDRVKEPLEHLRYLAEQYKTSSGLAEPLNLSIKASTRDTHTNPVSSFAPPSSSKNPKFLNKPSTLYSVNHTGALRNEECETQDGESSEGVTTYSYPVKAREETHVKDVTESSSPMYASAMTLGTENDSIETAQKRTSPEIDFTIWPKDKMEASPDVKALNLSRFLPSLSQDKDGKMEIEIPLSVFHKWLKLCETSASMPGAKEPPLHTQEKQPGQRNGSDADVIPTNLTFHMNPQHQSTAEDLRLRNVPSPTPSTHPISNHHFTSHNGFSRYKPLSSGDILKNATSQNVFPFDQQNINKSYNAKFPNSWHADDKDTQAPKMCPNYVRAQQELASRMQKSDMGPSALLMMNSSSASQPQLTTEEIIKLKKIISSSS